MTEQQLQHFWAKVDKSPNEKGCWIWLGARQPNGYGHLTVDKVTRLAHRYIFEHFNGLLGDLNCLHNCDNPSCVNPAHLYKGTLKDNASDRIIRTGGTSRSHVKRLTEFDVNLVRELLRSGFTATEVAEICKKPYSTVLDVKNRRTHQL